LLPPIEFIAKGCLYCQFRRGMGLSRKHVTGRMKRDD
jgi:hypothetical protein